MKKFNLIEVDTYRGIESFFLGVVVCKVLENFRVRLSGKKILVTLIVTSAAIGVFTSSFLLYRYPLLQRTVLLLGLFPCLIVITYFVELKDKAHITKLARISFEVFVWHYPLIALEKLILLIFGIHDIARDYSTLVLFSVIVWLFSSIIYRYVEVPLQKKLQNMEL